MKELKSIIELKVKELGGMAKLAKALNWGSEKNPTVLISKYLAGNLPSIDFAVRWKQVFGENLIDLMLEDDTSNSTSTSSSTSMIVEESSEEYNLISKLKFENEMLREALREIGKGVNQTK